MKNPPSKIDGAKVLEWAWSGSTPFGVIRDESGETLVKVFGLAICRYPGSQKIYRFSCDSDWESEQDSEYDSIAEAKNKLPSQYQETLIVWRKGV